VNGPKFSELPPAVYQKFSELNFEPIARQLYWAMHIFDIPSSEFCVSGFAPAFHPGPIPPGQTDTNWKARGQVGFRSPLADRPSIPEMTALVSAISDEETVRLQAEISRTVLVFLPRALAETVCSYLDDPLQLIRNNSPIALCGLQHMFLKGERNRFIMGYSRTTGIVAYKTGTKLLVALMFAVSYVEKYFWPMTRRAVESLESDLLLAGL